jgi:hypothetical protein
MTGLEEFNQVIADFRNISSLAVKGAVAAPFADVVLRQFNLGLAPPWPTGVLIISSVAELLALIYIFHYWRSKTQKSFNKRMLGALLIMIVGFSVYIYLFATFTRPQPKTREMLVLGFEPANAPLEAAFKEGYTADQALDENEYNPALIWTPRSINAMRFGLLAVWLLTFIALSIFIGAFVIAQRRRSVKL